MFKVVFTLWLFLAFIPATFASKARMQALSQNAETGSYYIVDTRSIFANPAYINTVRSYVITEWGVDKDQNDMGGTPGTADVEATPHAEGGFFHTFGAFSYGLYFGNDINSQDDDTDRDNMMPHDNGIDLFFGGDAGLEWGARFHFAKNRREGQGNVNDGTTGTNPAYAAKQTAIGLGLGVIKGNFEFYSNLDLTDESEGKVDSTSSVNKGDKWEADLGINFGVAYAYKGWTYFGDYYKYGNVYTEDASATAGHIDKTEGSTITVGGGYILEIEKKSKAYFDLSLLWIRTEDTDVAGTGISATGAKVEQKQLPITVGYETAVKSWLSLRGSVQYKFLAATRTTHKMGGKVNNSNGAKVSDANQTSVAAGLTINLGKLKLDGMVAKTKRELGRLNFDDFATRMSAHFWF